MAESSKLHRKFLTAAIVIGFAAILILFFHNNCKSGKKMYLPEVSLPDIPDIEYVLYDIVNAIDSQGYTASNPCYYFQVNKITSEEIDGAKKESYTIDIQWANSGVHMNDSASGFLVQYDIEPKKYFILTSTNMKVNLAQRPMEFQCGQEFPIEDFIRRRSDRDSSISLTSTLEKSEQNDTIETFYTISEKIKVKFEISKYFTTVIDQEDGTKIRFIHPEYLKDEETEE